MDRMPTWPCVLALRIARNKFFGWHGGRGYRDVLRNWNQKYNIPIAIGVLGLFTEIAGVPAMNFRFLVRPAALGLAIFLAVAMKKAH